MSENIHLFNKAARQTEAFKIALDKVNPIVKPFFDVPGLQNEEGRIAIQEAFAYSFLIAKRDMVNRIMTICQKNMKPVSPNYHENVTTILSMLINIMSYVCNEQQKLSDFRVAFQNKDKLKTSLNNINYNKKTDNSIKSNNEF